MKKNWYWLIPIVVAFLVGYFLRGVWLVGLERTTPTGYEIFRDLLSILLGLLIGAGTLIYLVIRKVVTEKIRDQIKETFSRITGRLLIHEAVMDYHHGLYETAIRISKNALSIRPALKEPDIIYAKSNLAYYYAAKHTGHKPHVDVKPHEQWENRDEAIKLAKLAYDKYDPYRDAFNEPTWVDNYIFVKAVFAKTPEEKREVRECVDTLLSRRDLQTIREELTKNLDYL